jgi:hypothetical protein
VSSRKLYLEELGFLVPEQLVYLADVVMGEVFEFPLRPAALVLARLAVLDQLVQ